MITCEVFDGAADELALGQVAEPLRSSLLAHAAACARCGPLLGDLLDVADRLLDLAPEAEPPVGFEQRVVPAPAVDAPAARRRWLLGAGVAAAIAAAVLLGVRGDDAAVATVLDDTGAPSGTVEIDDGRLELVLEGDADWPGTWSCELRTADGRWVEVGTWTAADVVEERWSVPVPARISHGATAMRVLGGRGRVLYTAAL